MSSQSVADSAPDEEFLAVPQREERRLVISDKQEEQHLSLAERAGVAAVVRVVDLVSLRPYGWIGIEREKTERAVGGGGTLGKWLRFCWTRWGR